MVFVVLHAVSLELLSEPLLGERTLPVRLAPPCVVEIQRRSCDLQNITNEAAVFDVLADWVVRLAVRSVASITARAPPQGRRAATSCGPSLPRPRWLHH